MIARAIIDYLPQYDYLYLGDTKRVPYGNRSQDVIHEFTSQALDYLFAHDCQLVILACNTASAEALRKSQQEYLPARQPDKRVLGVLIPTAEAAVEMAGGGGIGILATSATVESGSYVREIAKLSPVNQVLQKAAPLLVPMVENDGLKYVAPILKDYLADLPGISALVLGCTHYCALKSALVGLGNFAVVSSDDVVPPKLADYLRRHPEIESKLSQGGTRRFCVTDLTTSYEQTAERMVGSKFTLELVSL